ncbi:hypothetical protein HDU87_001542 [Geranomyces variabilis]|uniref:SET domain-containing protein n=1 Tax=Geranomyces variabilis TaxID=109894 RepID=A0AAD5TMB0_9FUNG|nr:hypothetical protein HDU87_001542 [Geranomyces variabilis]
MLVPSEGRTIEQLASKLPQPAKDDYFSLSSSHVDYPVVAENIWYTNSLDMGDFKDRIGIFLVISRFNHSCTPNALFHWSETLNRQVVYNIKPIAKGQEIEVAYISVMSPPTTRQNALKKNFNFVCHCTACSLPCKELEISASRRSECVAIAQRIDTQLDRGKPLVALCSIRRAMDLAKLEGVWESETAPLCYDAFRICVLWGDELHARQWADLAFKLCSLIKGHNSADAIMMRRLRDDPKSEKGSNGKSLWAALGEQILVGPFEPSRSPRMQELSLPSSFKEPAKATSGTSAVKLSTGQKKKIKEKAKRARLNALSAQGEVPG